MKRNGNTCEIGFGSTRGEGYHRRREAKMRSETVLGVLLGVGCGAWRFVAGSPAVAVELWQVVTYTGVALLGIGLVRDLYIKFVVKPGAPKRAGEKLICFESLVGSLL